MESNISLTPSSWREADFYAMELEEKFGVNSKEIINDAIDLAEADKFMLNEIYSFSLSEIRDNLGYKNANLVDKLTLNLENKFEKELICKLKQKFEKEDQLANEAFDWIKNDSRICAFCYHFLINNSQSKRKSRSDLKWNRDALRNNELGLDLETVLRSDKLFRLFNIHSQELSHNSHNQRFEIIQMAFRTGEISIHGQQYLMALLSEAWTITRARS